MTHFIGAVVVPADVETFFFSRPTPYPDLYGRDAKDVEPSLSLKDFLDTALEKFDENRQVPRWISAEELIAEGRQKIEEYRTGLYAQYLADPEKYAEGVTNTQHLDYLRSEFPKKLEWTDEEVLADAQRWYDETRDDGAAHTTYNQDSKWDWWTIGGRWEEKYRDLQGQTVGDYLVELNAALARAEDPVLVAELEAVRAEVDRVAELMKTREATWDDHDKASAKLLDCAAYLPWWFPYNVVVPRDDEFVWLEKGNMGWWGMHSDKFGDVDWVRLMIEELSKLNPADRLVFIDFHI